MEKSIHDAISSLEGDKNQDLTFLSNIKAFHGLTEDGTLCPVVVCDLRGMTGCR